MGNYCLNTKIININNTIQSINQSINQSRLNVLGGLGPARLMGPLSSLWPVVLCNSESGNTHLVSVRIRHDVKLQFTKWGLTCFHIPKCMKTGGTCSSYKNYKTSQLERLKFNPSPQCLPHPPSEFKPWNKRILCVLCCTCM